VMVENGRIPIMIPFLEFVKCLIIFQRTGEIIKKLKMNILSENLLIMRFD